MKPIAIVGAGLRGPASAVYHMSVGNQAPVFERDQPPAASEAASMIAPKLTAQIGSTPSTTRMSGIPIAPLNQEMLYNLNRMVEAEGARPHISLNTPVESVSQTNGGKRRINDDSGEEFDGLPGHISAYGDLPIPRT